MEKYHFKELENLHYSTNIQKYCIDFIQLFSLNISILSENNFYQKFHFKDDELFPESSQCFEAFNYGKLDFVINFIYHFAHSNKNWLSDNNFNFDLDEKNLFTLLFYDNSDIFLFKKISFQPEILLSSNNWLNVLTYLFLFFLPCISNYDLLFHHHKKIPLLCCHEISDENFDLILYLMQKYSSKEFQYFCHFETNFNFLLIDDFISSNKRLYVIKDAQDWKKHLPLYKINRLFNYSCFFKNFIVKQQFLYLYKDIPIVLNIL